MMQHLDTFLQILKQPPLFEGPWKDDDKECCERLLSEFDDAEVEELASVSYAYWIVSSTAKERLPADSKHNAALKEIRRHYVGEYRDCVKALIVIREAMEYRREYRFNLIRSCFYDEQYDNEEDAELAKKYRKFVSDDLKRQPMVVRGVDMDNRTIIYKPPRGSSSDSADDNEAFIVTQIYTAEKAVATSEFTSKATEERLTVVFNFRDYSRKNSPSTSTVATVTKIMQRCFPERLGILVIADAPFWMKTLVTVLKPVMSQATRDKFRMPSGQTAIDKEFRKIIRSDEKLQNLLTSGEISSVDVSDYVMQPFYSQYE
mmetsp:Transcript_15828/g.43790  ORF Transcript_15828/g.43790 Transcript_15828/m.43790 type:complete len:317 (+) Transcript_15828:146-1096(+)